MKTCSCYDSDCFTIPDPFNCWMGCVPRYDFDIGVDFPGLPVADGYCPLVKETKEDSIKEEVKNVSNNKG